MTEWERERDGICIIKHGARISTIKWLYSHNLSKYQLLLIQTLQSTSAHTLTYVLIIHFQVELQIHVYAYKQVSNVHLDMKLRQLELYVDNYLLELTSQLSCIDQTHGKITKHHFQNVYVFPRMALECQQCNNYYSSQLSFIDTDMEIVSAHQPAVSNQTSLSFSQ